MRITWSREITQLQCNWSNKPLLIRFATSKKQINFVCKIVKHILNAVCNRTFEPSVTLWQKNCTTENTKNYGISCLFTIMKLITVCFWSQAPYICTITQNLGIQNKTAIIMFLFSPEMDFVNALLLQNVTFKQWHKYGTIKTPWGNVK